MIGLNGPSPAVEMMLRFLAYPRASAEGKECAWLGKDLDTERFRETPAEFGDLWIKALSSSTDTAFLTLYASTELDTYQKALAEAEKCEQEQGSCAAAAVAGRAACAEVLASTLRGFSYMTLVPESLESLVSLPPCFPVIVKAFKALAGKFLACPAWRESLAAPIGYALMVFANATPAQYLWGHPGNVRARAAIQPFAATLPFKHLCNSAFKTLDTEDVPRLIIQLIETLAAPGALWHPHHRLLPVLLDTLGAIVCGNKEFLERLVSSTKILKIVSDALTAQDAQDAEAVPANAEGGTDSEATATATTTTTTTTITTAQKNQIEFMFKINAYRFAYFLMYYFALTHTHILLTYPSHIPHIHFFCYFPLGAHLTCTRSRSRRRSCWNASRTSSCGR